MICPYLRCKTHALMIYTSVFTFCDLPSIKTTNYCIYKLGNSIILAVFRICSNSKHRYIILVQLMLSVSFSGWWTGAHILIHQHQKQLMTPKLTSVLQIHQNHAALKNHLFLWKISNQKVQAMLPKLSIGIGDSLYIYIYVFVKN